MLTTRSLNSPPPVLLLLLLGVPPLLLLGWRGVGRKQPLPKQGLLLLLLLLLHLGTCCRGID
jgi:hypothetical protein